jgi:trigger factor
MFQHNHIPELVAEIRRGKALAQIVESATVTDGSGNVVDLKNLRPDGTLGDPAEQAEAPAAADQEPAPADAPADTAADGPADAADDASADEADEGSAPA